MRALVVVCALLIPAGALAQGNPPTVGGRPLVQVKPRGTAATAKPKPKSIAARLQACLEIEDGSKGRLDCYDAVIKPQPKPKPPSATKSVTECRFFKEEDERLNCFNGFVEKLPKLPS